MKREIALAALCVASWTCLAAPAGEPKTPELIRTMQSSIDMKFFQNPMTLKEFAGLLHEMLADRGMELSILINQKSFAATDATNDVCEAQVKFPPYPKTTTAATALRMALSQLPHEATYLVRNGHVEVIAAQEAAFAKLRTHKVFGHYSAQRVFDVISDLCEQTGLSVVIDARIDPKFNTPVSVTFRNDISVQDALHTLTDMAGLRLVDVRSGYYVTTRDNKSAEKIGN